MASAPATSAPPTSAPPDPFLGRRLVAATRMARWEGEIERALLRALRAQRAKALARLRASTLVADARPVDLFDQASWDTAVEEYLMPVAEAVFADVAAVIGRTLPAALPAIDVRPRAARLSNLVADMAPDVATSLGRSLTVGVNRGESIDKLTSRVSDVFDDMAESRARTIARTETIGAANGAGFDAAGAVHLSGVELEKTWLATNDEVTRPDHADADGQTVPYDQPFDVGGEELMYPGDDNGSAEQVCNCRCTCTYDSAGSAAAPGSASADTGDVSDQAEEG